MSDPQLTQCLQLLLQDEVICSYRYSPLFTFLDDEANRARVSQTLQLLGRDVRQTSDRDAYLCCYDNIAAPEVTAACKERFKRVAQDLQPLVQWLCLVMDCTPNGTPIRPGDNYSKTDVLARIEQSHSLCERLATLASNRLFGSRSQDATGQLQQIFNKLVDMGYFISVGHAGTRFQASGKWSVLYDQLGFIKAYEALDTQDDVSQGAFL